MSRLYLAVALTLLLISTNLSGNQRPPAPKVDVLQPQAGQALGGMVDVRVKLPAELSGPAYVGLGGPPWVQLEQIADTDQWRALLDSKMVPNGPQMLMIKTLNRRCDVVVETTVKNPLKVYFADLHCHTSYSDGVLVPPAAHEYARDVSKLDVFSLTDHLELVDDTEWVDMRETAWKANEDGRFVSIPGLEWTKKIGHINLVDPKTRHWPQDLAGFYKAAAEADVVCKFNHPGDGTKVYNAMAYSEAGDKAVQLMEVRRGPEEQAYILALKNGWHIAPDGSDDTHTANWGRQFAWTGIVAPGLSKRNILHALKNRHCYSTRDRDCKLRFKINDATMGDIIAEPVDAVTVTVNVNDPNPNDTIAKIELFEDGAVVETDEPNATRRRWRTKRTPGPGTHYYFVKVTQIDNNMLWSAPIWITADEN